MTRQGRPRAAAILLVVAAALTLAACGSDDNSDSGTAAKGGDPVELTFSVALDASETAKYREVVDEWNSTHKDIQVKLKNTPWDSYWQEKQVESASQRLPDVWDFVPGYGALWIDRNQLLPISSYLEKDPDANLEDTNATMREYLTRDGQLYGLPYDFNGVALFYNKKLLEEAGIPLPDDSWTLEDLRDAAETASAKLSKGSDKVYGFAFEPLADWRAEGWFQAFGASLISDDGTVEVNNDKGREALEYLVGLVDSGAAPRPEDRKSYQLFSSGKAAMTVQSGDALAIFDEAKDLDYGIVRMPLGPSGTSGVGLGGAYVISRTTKHPEQAYEFLKYMTSTGTLEKIIVGGVPARESAWENANPTMKAYSAAIQDGPPMNAVQGALQVVDEASSTLEQVFNGSLSVDQALAQVEERGNAALSKAGDS